MWCRALNVTETEHARVAELVTSSADPPSASCGDQMDRGLGILWRVTGGLCQRQRAEEEIQQGDSVKCGVGDCGDILFPAVDEVHNYD